MNSPDSAGHPGRPRFNLTELTTAFDTAQVLDYEQAENAGVLEKRLIEQVRTSLPARQPLLARCRRGELQSLALPYESYQLAFTPGLVADLFGGRVDESMLQEGGYVSAFWARRLVDTLRPALFYGKEGDPHRRNWRRLRPTSTCPGAMSIHSAHPPLLRYDDYDLLLVETRDAIGNQVTVGERALNGDLAKQGNEPDAATPVDDGCQS